VRRLDDGVSRETGRPAGRRTGPISSTDDKTGLLNAGAWHGQATAALYRAKHGGRDQVCSAIAAEQLIS